MATKKYSNSIININGAYNRLRRRMSKCIYYNADCFIKLRPSELENIEILLEFLYNYHLKNKDDPNYKGLKQEELTEAFAIKNKNEMSRERAVKVTAWLMIPQFINVKSYGFKRDARRYKLNKYGVKLVELMIEDSKKKAAEPDNQEQVDVAEEEDIEDDVSGNSE